jgi:SAM-dependent methyltransferase
LPDQHFDAVYLSHLLEHIHDPGGLIQECYRVLKPGGTIVALTPNVECRLHRQIGADWPGPDPPRHLVLFSRRTLRTVVERAGFSATRLPPSARLAAPFWIGGTELRRHGDIESSKRPPPILHIIAGVLCQYVERTVMFVQPDAGGEIVLIARGPS